MKFVSKLKDLLAYSSVVNLLIIQERPLFKVGKPKLGRNHSTAVIHHNLCNVSMSIFDCHFLLSRFCLTLANVQVWIRHGHRNSICYQTHWFFSQWSFWNWSRIYHDTCYNINSLATLSQAFHTRYDWETDIKFSQELLATEIARGDNCQGVQTN